MNTAEFCHELIDLDIIKIQLIPHAGTTMDVPFQVPNIITVDGTLALPAITLALTDGADADAIFSASGSNIKVSSSREAAGVVHTHALQVQIDRGAQSVRELEAVLTAGDYHILLTNAAGERYFGYGLPESTQVSYDDQMGSNSQLALKIQIKSLSGLILLL